MVFSTIGAETFGYICKKTKQNKQGKQKPSPHFTHTKFNSKLIINLTIWAEPTRRKVEEYSCIPRFGKDFTQKINHIMTKNWQIRPHQN